MTRALKTFTTSAGFFDLAVAAPSMKAALEAWGSGSNLFHQGFAKVSDDPAIVAATMAKPGVVLRRPVGTDRPYTEDAELPSELAAGGLRRKPPRRTAAPRRADDRQNGDGRSGDRQSGDRPDDKAARQAAVAFEREQQRRRRAAQREAAARDKQRARRDRAIEAADTALRQAERDHQAKVAKIEKARAALERKLEAEEDRWSKQREHLESALRRARAPGHLRVV
jgi:hypothetical protein